MSAGAPQALATATEHQPAAGAALASALAGSPSHAYLFAGPPGSGKRAAGRAFAAELLADGAPDPDEARRRALAEPSPHPDLVWLEPPGNQHLVDEVRERVIGAAAYRPFEGARRVFVIADADALAEESQNALLKTLEEPASFAHLILISAEPEALLETVRSRCLQVGFSALSPEALVERLRGRYPGAADEELGAVARLAGGDLVRAELLLSDEGRALRSAAEACARGARSAHLDEAPWTELLESAEATGEAAAEESRTRSAAFAAEAGEETGPAARRRQRDGEEAAKRAARRARTAALDLGLTLIGSWLRDLAAVAEGAAELVLAQDRASELRTDAEDLDPRRARRAAELVLDTRRRLQVNVAEELALEALLFRVEFVLTKA